MLTLVYRSSKQPVKVGDIVCDFRGEPHIIEGWQEPRHSGSSGRINTSKGSFYPSVCDMEFIASDKVAK